MIVGQKKQSARGMTTTVCALVVLAGAAMPGGCREDPAALQSVKKASHSINAVAGGAEASVAMDRQDAGFKKALGELGTVKLDAGNPLSSATGILTAASQLGSAGTPTQAAQASMSTLSSLRSELRSAVSQWTAINAVADASAFDPAPKLAELDSQLTAAKGEQKQALDRLDAVRREQDAMMSSAKDKAAQAAKFEQDSVKLREESRRMKASEAQAVLAKALEAKKQCDELRLALAKIEADATLLEPRKLGLNQRLQELEIGIASVETERARVVKRGEESKVIESESRAKAAEAGGVIDAFAKKIAEEREKNLGPALEEIVGICKKAASSAGAAKGDSRQQTGAMFGAIAKHRLGEVLLLRAAEAKQHAALMNELAAIKPSLAGQASYAEAAKTALEFEKTATQEAKEAIEGARTGYKSIKVKGEADQATQLEVIKYLTKIGGLEPDESEAAPATDATPAEGEGPEKGDKPAGEDAAASGEVRAFLTELGKAMDSGDAEQIAAKVHVEGATAEQLAPVFAMSAAGAKLDKACKAKFDTTLAEAMKDSPMGAGMGGGMPKLPTSAEVETAKIDVTGETASVTAEGGAPVALKKVDGSWKVDLTESIGKPEMLEQMGKIGGKVATAMGELAAEVDADKYATIQDVFQAMMAKVVGAMGSSKGEGEGPGEGSGGGKGGGGGGGGVGG